MFGSQALETAIGLSMLLFIIATAASAITESVSRMLRKRSTDLEKTIKEMLTESAPEGRESRSAAKARLDKSKPFFDVFKATSVWRSADAASGRTFLLRRKVGASYMSAKAFADGVVEALRSEGTQNMLESVPGLANRLKALEQEATRGLLDVKAGVESWFDETMQRAEGAYKRWAAALLFLTGLVLAVAANASTTNVAGDLWSDSATRAAVTEAVTNTEVDSKNIETFADATEKLDSFALPVGWAGEDPNNPVDYLTSPQSEWSYWGRIFGWLMTGLLVMLGGPFWFDLLTRLVALRSAGTKPSTAAIDEGSATNRAATAPTPAVVKVEIVPDPANPATQQPAVVVQQAAGVDPDTTHDDLKFLRDLLPSAYNHAMNDAMGGGWSVVEWWKIRRAKSAANGSITDRQHSTDDQEPRESKDP